MISIQLILLIAAVVCFIAAIVQSAGKNLLAWGLALWVLSVLVAGHVLER